jgi:hypothetical protein
MNLEWYQKMIAEAQQRQPTQPQTKQQIVDAAREAARSTQTFAMPAFTDPNWKPMTTADVLGPDYVAQEGGPTAEQLDAHPVWQSILSLMSGAPVASIANSNDMPTMLQNVLSGVQKLDMAPIPGQMDSAATYIAPMPGQAGWVNPTWGSDARPGDVMPPQPSTNDLGHYMPDATGSTWDPYAQGTATSPTSWLGQAQQGFSQGPPTTPVVNPWGYQQQNQPQPAAPMKQGREGYWQNNSTVGDYSTPRPGVGAPWGKAWYS